MAKIDFQNRIFGVALILIGLLVYHFRPGTFCQWYEVTCKFSALFTPPLFLIFMLIAIFSGLYMVIKK